LRLCGRLGLASTKKHLGCEHRCACCENRKQQSRQRYAARRLRLVAPVPFSWTASCGLSKLGFGLVPTFRSKKRDDPVRPRKPTTARRRSPLCSGHNLFVLWGGGQAALLPKRSLCDAPINMRLWAERERSAPIDQQTPASRNSALIDTFIFLNSLANAAHCEGTNLRSKAVSETAAVLLRFLSNKVAFHSEQKWGPPKWTDAIRNSWTSKCEGLRRQEMKA
jgi:hypothetical protein